MENSVLQQMHDNVICSDLQGIKYFTEQNKMIRYRTKPPL